MEKLVYAEYLGYGCSINKPFIPTGRWMIDNGLLYLEHRGYFGFTSWFGEDGLHFIPPEPVINCCRAS